MVNRGIMSSQLILPAVFIVIGLMAGFIFERVISAKLRQLSMRTKWEGDEIIMTALRGIVTFWFIAASVYVALLNIPMKETLFDLLRKILLAAVIFSVTLFLAKVVVGFLGLFTRKKKGVLPSTSIITNLAKLIIFVLGGLIILQSLGISVTPVLTALGVGGLAVALALHDTLSNLFSGLYLIVSRQIKPGDYIKLESGEEGYVADISWRNTTIRALASNMIVVPNSKLAAAVITNYYQPGKEMGLTIAVRVSYDSDLEYVEQVTLEVAKEVMRITPGSAPEYEPAVRYHTFGECGIELSVVLRVREFGDQYLLKHQFIKRLQERYQREGINIPYPIRTVVLKKRE
ncbi:MAG TPA: mechanosensitive ion channel family protein [Bacillota bacterium]|nr:mechanosensitive ion channel family protein [Bacillota bacterium]